MNIQERSISISTRTILKVIVTIVALMFLWAVRDVIAVIFTALILAALINPIAQWAARHKIPKGIAVLVFYLLVFGGLALAIILVIPQVLEQIVKLASTVGGSWQVLSNGVDWLKQFSDQYGLSQNLQAGVDSLQTQITAMVAGLFTTVGVFFGGIAGLAVVLVLTFYMVVEEEEAFQWFKNFLPEDYQKLSTRVLTEVQSKFGSWLLGQLVLCFIVGIIYYIGLSIMGVEGALVLAILGGFTEFIPYLGPILGGIPAVIVATAQSPMLGLLTLILYVLVQQLENHVLVPKVMQKAVGINPVISIVALLVGAQLFGITGAILAIPVATACSVIIMEIWRFYKT